jgi:hypothetical protein
MSIEYIKLILNNIIKEKKWWDPFYRTLKKLE